MKYYQRTPHSFSVFWSSVFWFIGGGDANTCFAVISVFTICSSFCSWERTPSLGLGESDWVKSGLHCFYTSLMADLLSSSVLLDARKGPVRTMVLTQDSLWSICSNCSLNITDIWIEHKYQDKSQWSFSFFLFDYSLFSAVLICFLSFNE